MDEKQAKADDLANFAVFRVAWLCSSAAELDDCACTDDRQIGCLLGLCCVWLPLSWLLLCC